MQNSKSCGGQGNLFRNVSQTEEDRDVKPRWFPKRRDIYYGVTSDHFCLTTNKAYLLRSKSVYRATGFDLKLGTSHCTRIESSGAYGDIIRSFAAILPLLLPPMWEMSDCEA